MFQEKPEGKQTRKLKIICFHGFGTNGEMMKTQMRHLYHLMQPYADLVFPNGSKVTSKSLVVDPAVHKFIGEALSYSWFDYRNLPEAELVQTSIDYMEALLEAEGPFDGMIGFSQGGAFVHLMILALSQGMFRNKRMNQMRFAILICTAVWKWNSIELKGDVHPIDFPTFHFMSKSDFLYQLSVASTTRFVNPYIMHHGEGHKIPRIGMENFKELMQFVNKAMKVPSNKPKAVEAKL